MGIRADDEGGTDMNLINGVVTKVQSKPIYIDTYPDVKWWQVRVEYDSYGRLSEQNLVFKTEMEANKVAAGYEFLT